MAPKPLERRSAPTNDARAAGEDAAKRRMRKAGRTEMSARDYDHAVAVMEKMLFDLGYDTQGWIALAGAPRNEPEPPPKPKRTRRSRRKEPVQLAFAFA
jgi:hypothetical protein